MVFFKWRVGHIRFLRAVCIDEDMSFDKVVIVIERKEEKEE